MQRGADALRERVGQAEDGGGDALCTNGGSGEAAAAVGAVDVGVGQIGAGCVEAVVFIKRQALIGLLHGGDVAEGAGYRQIGRGCRSAGRRGPSGDIVGKGIGRLKANRRRDGGEVSANWRGWLFHRPSANCLCAVAAESGAVAMQALPSRADVAGGGKGRSAVWPIGRWRRRGWFDRESSRQGQGGDIEIGHLRAVGAGAVNDVAAVENRPAGVRACQPWPLWVADKAACGVCSVISGWSSRACTSAGGLSHTPCGQ